MAVRLPSDPATPAKVRLAGRTACLTVAAFAAIYPLVVTNPTYTSIGVFTLIFAAAAASWNGFSGYSGYISLGNGIFYGCGAYTMALLANDLHMAGGAAVFVLVPLAGLVGAAVAVPVGLIALRTRRHTFVVLTIGLFFAFQLSAFNLGFTQGTSGLQLPLPNWSGNTYNDPFYYVAYAIALVAAIGFWGVRRSRLGLQLLAIRDDEDRARGIGVQALRVKLLDFTFAGFVTGMCGALFAFFVGQIYPQFAFDPVFDVTVALMTFFGGIGTITGPLLGALVLEPVAQYLALGNVGGNQGYLIVYGAVFLAILLFMPRGIVPMLRVWAERLFDRTAERSPSTVRAPEPTAEL
ncbi:MAG: branched-chain amino acid ABC transporter permease [Acidimicrobiales bacterium]